MSYFCQALTMLSPGLHQEIQWPISVRHSSRKLLLGARRRSALNQQAAVNWPAHAETQHQEAASRRVLCSGGLQRSTANS